MFDRFTDRARRVLGLARQEAQRFQHDYIGTEHVLLGLIRETEGIAAQALGSAGLDAEAVRVGVREVTGVEPSESGEDSREPQQEREAPHPSHTIQKAEVLVRLERVQRALNVLNHEVQLLRKRLEE